MLWRRDPPKVVTVKLFAQFVRGAGTGLLLAAVAALCWWGWLGWDTTYYSGPDGQPAGPYRPWQAVGCVLTLVAVALVAYRRANPVLVGVAMTVGFTASVSATWIPPDESGLAVLGVIVVVAGMTAAATVLPWLEFGVRSLLARVRH